MSFEELYEIVKTFVTENWWQCIIGVIAAWFILTTLRDIVRRFKSTGNYRNDFIKAKPGKRRLGKPGYWYRCACCHKWCARPGRDNVTFPDSVKMEVDHIRPWSMGGSDAIYNLQPMCKPCNRGKSNSHTVKDAIKMKINLIFHPVDSIIGARARKAVRQNKLLRKVGIGRRK